MRKFILGSLVAVSLFGCGSSKGKETGVNLYMWGGSQEINKFIDEVIAPDALAKTGVKINRVPIADAKDTVNKMIVEKQAGKKNGSVDILWVNGENFKTLKEAGLLTSGSNKNFENLALLKESTLEKDFGVAVEGMETPWGEAQFNFIYDSKKGGQPFQDYETLAEYVKKNPGRVTYPETTNFTGSAFVRNIAIDILGLENIEEMTEEELKTSLEEVWAYFRELKPYLWRKGETYPESEGKLDTLYSSGEIDFTMGYTISKVDSKVAAGQYPESSKSFLLKNGTLFNNHYLAIPNNSKNPEGAALIVNYFISPEAQIMKQDPKNWGDLTVLDLSKLDEKVQEEFKRALKSDRVPPMEELVKMRVRELSPEKAKIIDQGWIENVGQM
ncbi:MAG: ABC transporter substrate-binding protein [Fusobacteriaceae bacterium]